jgi:hypothetical protein
MWMTSASVLRPLLSSGSIITVAKAGIDPSSEQTVEAKSTTRQGRRAIAERRTAASRRDVMQIKTGGAPMIDAARTRELRPPSRLVKVTPQGKNERPKKPFRRIPGTQARDAYLFRSDFVPKLSGFRLTGPSL